MKHGILSKAAVLPHENELEFTDLLQALEKEHRPAGPTEMHLIEELASIIWRKRRVLLAEGAAINRALRSVASDPLSTPAKSALPFECGMPDKPIGVRRLMASTPEQITEMQEQTRNDVVRIERAAAILRRGGTDAYEKALDAVMPGTREWWDDSVESGEYRATVKGLTAYICDSILPAVVGLEREARHYHAIKAQMLGEGLKPERLETLARYETHLDRKFERSLAMLLKVKQLRGFEAGAGS